MLYRIEKTTLHAPVPHVPHPYYKDAVHTAGGHLMRCRHAVQVQGVEGAFAGRRGGRPADKPPLLPVAAVGLDARLGDWTA